jgi:predicted  nucleic acid-binding Zn-ribbon protein
MAHIVDLFALQETDLTLDKALARLAAIEESSAETEELIEARSLAEEKAAALKTLRDQQKDAEQEIDAVRTKAADIERKLYSGSVKDPRELQDLDMDLKSLRENVRHREDLLIEVLEQAEAAEKECNEAQSALDALQADWNANQESMATERQQIEPEVERLQAHRAQQAADFDRSVISLYQLLRDRRGGQAVARIERGMCQGCRITLPVSVMQRARSGNGLVQCVSCERILVPE